MLDRAFSFCAARQHSGRFARQGIGHCTAARASRPVPDPFRNNPGNASRVATHTSCE